ncbi:uncharacterized protein TNCV_1711191 [Trichonephila clavipes]|nr:uncharacterized protein TNCV_1711191 [Trichonephila clavipes]
MLQSLTKKHTSLSEELYTTLKTRSEERHTEAKNVLRYLHNYDDFKNENEKEEDRLTKSNVIKFIVNFLKISYPQTYPHSEEFDTVIEDDDDTFIDSEKKLFPEQNLELVIAKRIQTN